VCSGNSLPTFRVNLSFPSSRTRPLKIGPIGCPKTSVKNYHCTLRNITEERGYDLLRGGSLKSHTVIVFITDMKSVYCAVRTVSLTKSVYASISHIYSLVFKRSREIIAVYSDNQRKSTQTLRDQNAMFRNVRRVQGWCVCVFRLHKHIYIHIHSNSQGVSTDIFLLHYTRVLLD